MIEWAPLIPRPLFDMVLALIIIYGNNKIGDNWINGDNVSPRSRC